MRYCSSATHAAPPARSAAAGLPGFLHKMSALHRNLHYPPAQGQRRAPPRAHSGQPSGLRSGAARQRRVARTPACGWRSPITQNSSCCTGCQAERAGCGRGAAARTGAPTHGEPGIEMEICKSPSLALREQSRARGHKSLASAAPLERSWRRGKQLLTYRASRELWSGGCIPLITAAPSAPCTDVYFILQTASNSVWSTVNSWHLRRHSVGLRAI